LRHVAQSGSLKKSRRPEFLAKSMQVEGFQRQAADPAALNRMVNEWLTTCGLILQHVPGE
jgi:hypothetical protein